MNKDITLNHHYPLRRWFVISAFFVAASCLLYRAYDLQVRHQDFLKDHGDARSIRVAEIPAHRGMITDRNDVPLAISTPVNSIWTTPRKLLAAESSLHQLAKLLQMKSGKLKDMLQQRRGREFVYLKRHVSPELEEKIMQLDLPGIYLQKEYRRYYPAGEVAAHIVGFNNVDDRGQEGLELAFDDWLKGTPGKKRVLKDRLGRTVENIESIKAPDAGKSLPLSIDRRIQYLAYRELKSAVNHHKARSGSLVLLDSKTGEVLAMVNQPSYNPNNRSGLKSAWFRNRAITDVFEPGSTMKPFTVAAALQSGLYEPTTVIDTTPGLFKVGSHTIKDMNNYGVIDVSTVIKKSSNVGASKIAMSMEPSEFWSILIQLGFGQPTGSGYPGESGGLLNGYNAWSDVEVATLSFGYGLSVTALQLAHAYTILAADGISRPVSLTRVEDFPAGIQVLSAKVAQNVRTMMAAVVGPEGTAKRASVAGYQVGGKTGTVHKSMAGGYAKDRYRSVFAGIAPLSDPRLVMVVMVDEPKSGQYFGGQVAAPVFSRVMEGALRLMNIPPDDLHHHNKPIVAAANKLAEEVN